MPELRLPADDFKVGDHVHLEGGGTVEVRKIERGEKGALTVNPGDADQLDGHVWEHATVTRPDNEPMVYVALLGGTTISTARAVPFEHRELAEHVVAQWAQDRGRPATVEDWPRQRWQQHGPGGLSTVRRTEAQRRQVFSMGPRSWTPDGRELRTFLSDFEGWLWAWDFEPDTYTDQPAHHRVEHRPGTSALTEATARGTDEAAVRSAFEQACAEAQRTCGESPYRDLWETNRSNA
ncbi:hypothetical protein [Streptomyces muensis]|uniref:Uncharacterized protein n=1 Tax=Streptomyces muensis TaxID=1077944 RepID=A0A9X1PWB2_STRM4|nr:hypothetical protein [Streptomyces muensis]MCF1592491.1 hypothetical protein [Streptomyces muensis]